MPAFAFRLASLLRLRESIRDQRRQELAHALRAEELLRQEQGRVEEELRHVAEQARRAAGPGEVQVDTLVESERFELVLLARRRLLATQQEMLQAEIQRRRHALVEANRQVQVLQRLRQRQLERHRQEENRREVLALDEAAQRRAVGQEVEGWGD